MTIQEQLRSAQDPPYREFILSLIPTADKRTVLGVRTPQIRAMAKQLYRQTDTNAFLDDLPHIFFEENQLHSFLIEQEKDQERCLILTEKFLPFIDNWATCDQFLPRALTKDKQTLISYIKIWIRSEHIYTVRFGLNMLMRYFLDDDFKTEYLEWVAAVDSDEYYLKMTVAWFFATALAKQYSATLPYLQQKKLPSWTHRKTIQKAIESRRLTPDQKTYLRTFK